MVSGLRDDHIAIIGIAGRFPGARNVREYWENLAGGVESITFPDDDDLRMRGVSETDLRDPDYIKAVPLVEDMEKFDAAFFGFTPLEAKVRDPQGRMFLEACHSALEDAGCVLSAYDGVVGVYGGGANDLYGEHHVKRNRAVARAAGTMGIDVSNHPDYLTTAVAYRLGLQGPAVNVQTACSTSLVAAHLACQALRMGECDLALAGGVEVELPYGAGHRWLEGGIFARDGRCRAFDAKAGGTIFGNGVGVVVLKRLGEARAEGDHVYAVIRGSAVNNDGAAKVGFTAPSAEGQARLIVEALAAAEADPATIDYVEAHGTGTLIGDPIEVAGLTRAFRAAGAEGDRYCALASVKSNIGHLGPAAGAAGLIKVCLAFEHGRLPPSINFEEPNPNIDFSGGPFFVNTELRPWERGGEPRRAGVSSFGIGGTNAHLVLEEPPPADRAAAASGGHHILPVSAKTPTALDRGVRRLAAHLQDRPELAVQNVAWTLQTGRQPYSFRAAAVAGGAAEAAEALRGEGPGRLVTSAEPARERGLAFMFPGQGAQHAGMAAGLYDLYSSFRRDVDECAGLLRDHLGTDLRTVLYPPHAPADRPSDLLAQTRFAQPALFVVEYALARLLMGWGLRPRAMVGHSVGEYVAAHLAGVLTLKDALALVAVRGALMQAMPSGGMLAVPMPEKLARSYLDDTLEIAAVNGPRASTVAGPVRELDELARTLAMQGVRCRRLQASHAFHTAMMKPVLAPFGEAVSGITLSPPTLPFISNVTGGWITEAQVTDPGYWVEHLRRAVRFSDGLETLAADPDLALVEVGPGDGLTALARQGLRGRDVPVVPAMRHPRRDADDAGFLAEAVARLWVAGADPVWTEMRRDRAFKVPLPEYPYERQTFWVDPDPRPSDQEDPAAREGRVLPVEESFFTPVWREAALPPGRTAVDPGRRWLVFGHGQRVVDDLVDALRLGGAAVTTVLAGEDFEVLDGDRVRIRPGHRADYDRLLARFEADAFPTDVIHAWTATPPPTDVLDRAHVGAVADMGFHGLLFLGQSLDRRSSEGPVSIMVVSSGLQEVSGEERVDPAKALMLGPVHAINREIAGVRCRSVDITLPALVPVEAVCGRLLAEAHASTDDVQVAWRGGKRWAWDQEKLPPLPSSRVPAVLSPGATYLITGGLGGIGLTVAAELARTVGARLVLVGRTPFPERADWEALLAEEGTDGRLRDRIRRLLAIEAAGGQLMVTDCDVTDAERLRALAKDVEQRFGPVAGVFHSASVTAGGMLTVKTREEAERVLGPKVWGTLALHQVFGARGAFLVLFSSIDAVVGNFGLADYCGANNFLDSFARGANLRGERVLSIGWGVWAEVGMAHEARTAAPEVFRELQQGLRHEPTNLSLLDRRVRDRSGDIVYRALLGPVSHWALVDHQIGGRGVLPGTYSLELVHQAFNDAVGGGDVEISDVVFLGPVVIAAARELRVVLSEDGDAHDVTIMTAAPGSGDWTEHVKARVRAVPSAPSPVHDLDAIRRACDREEAAPSGGDGSGLVRFGDHWGNIEAVRVGDREEIARLRLREDYHQECSEYTLHPSLLDDAVSNAQHLPIEEDHRYLPFAYEKVLVRGPLPPRFHSYIRHLDSADGEIITSDVTLIDDDGQELVRVTGYSLRRVDPEAVISSVQDEPLEGTAPDVGPADQGAAHGWAIGPEFGMEALRRLLDAWPRAHVVVSREELAAAIRRISGVTSETLETELSRAESAPASERLVATPYVEPVTEVQRTLATLAAQSLGLDKVGLDDDFLELGGNSLTAVQMGARIRAEFDIDLPLGRIFDRPTTRRLAEFVESARAATPEADSGGGEAAKELRA